jgi:hypothetical protein
VDIELYIQTFHMLSWCSTSEQGEIYFIIISDIDVNRCVVWPEVLNVILLIFVRQDGISLCDVELR